MTSCPDYYEDSNDSFWMFLACAKHGGGSDARVRMEPMGYLDACDCDERPCMHSLGPLELPVFKDLHVRVEVVWAGKAATVSYTDSQRDPDLTKMLDGAGNRIKELVHRKARYGAKEGERMAKAMSSPVGQALSMFVWGPHEAARDERIREGAEANGIRFTEGPVLFEGEDRDCRIRVLAEWGEDRRAYDMTVGERIMRDMEADPIAECGSMSTSERLGREVLSVVREGERR